MWIWLQSYPADVVGLQQLESQVQWTTNTRNIMLDMIFEFQIATCLPIKRTLSISCLFVCLLAWLVAVVSLQVEASPLGVTKALDHCVPQMQHRTAFFGLLGLADGLSLTRIGCQFCLGEQQKTTKNHWLYAVYKGLCYLHVGIAKSHHMDPYETMWEVFFSMAHVNREFQPTQSEWFVYHCSTGEKIASQAVDLHGGTLLTWFLGTRFASTWTNQISPTKGSCVRELFHCLQEKSRLVH